MSALDMEFGWDPTKAASNERKHGLPFGVAVALFADPHLLDVDATRDGEGESRRKAVGRIGGRLFTIVYTPRDGVVRVISARQSNVQEMRGYDNR